MKPDMLLRYAFALALLLAVTGWGTTATAQADQSAERNPASIGTPSPQTVFGQRGAIVQDGSFEDGSPNAFWTEFESTFGTPLCDAGCGTGAGTGPYDGGWWTWFGGIASATSGHVEQQLTIPSGSAELSFYLEIPAFGQPGSMSVLIDGDELFSVTEADAPAYATYQEVTVDVSAYADGGTHTLRFESVTQAGASATNFFVDLVSISTEGGGGGMTIAEARAAGPGTTVTVEGVVTRSKGAFTYIQDGTAGLTIRQTSGDFFDDVADGTITTGTRISVTGTLSEFRGLLQINQQNAEDNDLDSYSVVSQGNSVSAQTITIQELIDNGEDYEAELVRVTGLTVDATGTFEAATGYDATDATATLEAGLRVPNAADSDVDGMDIPEGEFTFTGVIGQFTFDDPADNGYQLMAIEETDISVAGTPVEEAIHDTGLVQFEVYATGNLGTEPAGPSSFPGTGFVFDGTLGLFTGSFVVGASPTQVSGNYYGGGSATFEWVEVQGLTELAPPFGTPYEDFDQAFEAVYNDSGAPNPIGLEVTQRSYSSTMAGRQGFVIVEFEVRNTSGGDLTGLYPGVFADWDVSTSATADFGGFDEETNLLYAYDDTGAVSTYFGVAALDRDDVVVSGVFYDALGSAEQDADIYTYLTTISDDPLLPDDRRTTVGVGPYDIPAGESVTVRFAFVGGADLNDVIANAEVAQGGAVASEVTTPAGTYALYSAYPNPFAVSTTLGFAVPEAQQVRLTVYDLLGRRVATLVDGIVQAGEQQVRLDATNLPSGTYIVRLEAGANNLTERVTVIR